MNAPWRAFKDLETPDVIHHLAVESELLDDATAPPTIYLWSGGEAVVIGRNQNPWSEASPDSLQHERPLLARRVSGGGAVYHGPGNLNFCISMPRALHAPHQRLAEIATVVSQVSGKDVTVDEQYNLRLDGRKISGTAFRLIRDRALHHGTLLVHADLAKLRAALQAEELQIATQAVASRPASVTNAGREGQVAEFAKALLVHFCGQADAPPPATPAAERVCQLRSWEWRFGHTPSFEASVGGQTISVENGKISNSGILAKPFCPARVRTILEATTFQREEQDE